METHQIIKNYFSELSNIFESYFDEPVNTILPFQKNTHDWLNYFYQSPLFRHIHLEYYKTDKICVLHINTFPDPRIDIPILGFDMIAIGNKITGLFFDFTPLLTTYKNLQQNLIFLKQNIKSPTRELPDWADFFSEDFICITPLEEELPIILNSIKDSILDYLQSVTIAKAKYNTNITLQNKYCQGQKKNDKTSKALAIEIGEENSQLFLNKYLFPEIAK
jgi:hypothetical protein